MTPTLRVAWVPRDPPLPVAGAWAEGPVAHALVARCLRDLDGEHAVPRTAAAARIHRLRGVGGGGFVALIGAAEDLPWVDGITWLGLAGPGLYVPTRIAPDRPADLVARAVTTLAGGPAVVLAGRLVPLVGARALTRGPLARWSP